MPSKYTMRSGGVRRDSVEDLEAKLVAVAQVAQDALDCLGPFKLAYKGIATEVGRVVP